jgi:hypothetical protein
MFPTYMEVYLRFYFEQLKSVSLTMLSFRFRVEECPFISRFRVGFTIYLSTLQNMMALRKVLARSFRFPQFISNQKQHII